MKNNIISISVCRVRSDSEYLDMIFDCSQTYYFSNLVFTVLYLENGVMKEKTVDVSDQYFNNTSLDPAERTTEKKHWNLSIPISTFDINQAPAIYIGTLTAKAVYTKIIGSDFVYGLPCPYNDPNLYEIRYNSGIWAGYVYPVNGSSPVYEKEQPVVGQIYSNCDTEQEEPVSDRLICSDVNKVYRCLLKDIFALNNCNKLSDETIHNYLLLYGHLAALTSGDFPTAKEYFRLMKNCFSKCSSSYNSNSQCSCKL